MSWCEHCHNTGSLDCYCGGDLCVCENYGEYPCPYCEGNDFACEEIDGQECPRCGGSDDVCSECGGQKVFPRKQKVDAGIERAFIRRVREMDMLGSVKRWIADAFVRLARCLVRSDERAAQRRLRKAESGK